MSVTWDSAFKDGAISLTNSNLTATNDIYGGGGSDVRSIAYSTTGKWYCEYTTSTHAYAVGVASADYELSENFDSSEYACALLYNGDVKFNYHTTSYTNLAFGNNDVIGVAFDPATGKLWLSVNGSWEGDPGAGTGEVKTLDSSYDWYLLGVLSEYTDATIVADASSLTYTVPSGFSALNSAIPNELRGNSPVATGMLSAGGKINGEILSPNGSAECWNRGIISGEFFQVTGSFTASPPSAISIECSPVTGSMSGSSAVVGVTSICAGGLTARTGNLGNIKIKIPVCIGGISTGAKVSLNCLPVVGSMSATTGTLARMAGQSQIAVGDLAAGSTFAGDTPKVLGSFTATIPSVAGIQGSIEPVTGCVQAGSAMHIVGTSVTGTMSGSVGNLARMSGKFPVVDGESICGATVIGGTPKPEINWGVSVGQTASIVGNTPRFSGSLSADIPRVLTIKGNLPATTGRLTTLQGTILTVQGNTPKPKVELTAISGGVWGLDYIITPVEGQLTSTQENIAALSGECRVAGQIVCAPDAYDNWIVKYRRP